MCKQIFERDVLGHPPIAQDNIRRVLDDRVLPGELSLLKVVPFSTADQPGHDGRRHGLGQRGELEHRLGLHGLLRLGGADAVTVLVKNLIVEDHGHGDAWYTRPLHRLLHDRVEFPERLVYSAAGWVHDNSPLVSIVGVSLARDLELLVSAHNDRNLFLGLATENPGMLHNRGAIGLGLRAEGACWKRATPFDLDFGRTVSDKVPLCKPGTHVKPRPGACRVVGGEAARRTLYYEYSVPE